MIYKFCKYFEIETLKEDKSVEENKKESQETNDGETDKTDSADDNDASNKTDSIDNDEGAYTTEDVLGRSLRVNIQMGLFDNEDGKISKIKVVDGKIYFYWDFFYGCGWYTRDRLREDARKLIDGITDQEILIGINRCKNGKK